MAIGQRRKALTKELNHSEHQAADGGASRRDLEGLEAAFKAIGREVTVDIKLAA
jgi:hypothetical protein